MPSSTAASIAGDRLGLDPQDLATLHQHQQLAHAQVRSPAGSAASSQGRLLLDPTSLQLLSRHFDRIMQAIQQRLEAVRLIWRRDSIVCQAVELGLEEKACA